ncbi:MAG: 30S ribosomal protein S17 [Candidatus Pacebacteria bacterium]|nr:30S ribosomal protein S17 [Candidatus Paceibacterota bacterium]
MKKTATDTDTAAKASKKRVLSGVVTSDKMKDTVVVRISRFVKAPKYGKYIERSKKYKAHNPGNTKKIGDKADIQECAPISKDKRFTVIK